jgi:hypothetical protein
MGKWLVSNNGGDDPLWSPDGRELFYRNANNEIMAVSVETEPVFKAGNPEMLFQAPDFGYSFADLNNWDISHDGKRFLMMKLATIESTEETSRPTINIVLNWFEELKERIPVD